MKEGRRRWRRRRRRSSGRKPVNIKEERRTEGRNIPRLSRVV